MFFGCCFLFCLFFGCEAYKNYVCAFNPKYWPKTQILYNFIFIRCLWLKCRIAMAQYFWWVFWLHTWAETILIISVVFFFYVFSSLTVNIFMRNSNVTSLHIISCILSTTLENPAQNIEITLTNRSWANTLAQHTLIHKMVNKSLFTYKHLGLQL